MSFLISFTILLLLGATIALWRCPASNYASSFLISRDTSAALKCVAAWMIIFHHLSLCSQDNLVMDFFHHEGIIFLNIFLILSGYGLAISYLKKGQAYLKGFFGKRLWRLLFPFIIAIVIFQVIDFACNPDKLSFSDKLKAFVIGRTDGLLPYSWYVFHQIICYIIFWISFKFPTNNHYRLIICFGINMLYYILLKMVLGFPAFWYINCIAFPAGLAYGLYAGSLPQINYNRRWWTLAMAALLCAMAIASSFVMRDIQNLLFAFAIILVFNISTRHLPSIVGYGNSYSYEVYLVQGLSILIFRSIWIEVSNDALFWIVCIITNLLAAYLLAKVSNRSLTSKAR